MAQWGFYFDQTRCVNCKACILACKAWNEDKRGDARYTPELTWLETDCYAEPQEYENLPGSTGELNFNEISKYHMKENWRRVTSMEFGDAPPEMEILNMSISCNHCEDPLCVKACPMKYIQKEQEFGIVTTVADRTCIGCNRCKMVCPWGSPQYYDSSQEFVGADRERRPWMTKCNLCIERIREGLKPACVAACPMRALDAGPMEELKEMHPGWSKEAEGLLPEGQQAVMDKLKPSIIFKRRLRRL